MPGFGSGPLGSDPAGQFNWARYVLFELAPEVYRTADLSNNDFFRCYAEAQGVSFDNLRQKIAAFAELRDPRAVRTRYDEVVHLRLGRVEPIRGPVEQSGVLATVSATQVIDTLRGRFTTLDIGKELTVSRSTIASNNAAVLITSVLSPTSLLTNPPLTLDTGPLRWEVRALETSEERQTLVQVSAGNVEPIAPGWILTDGFAEFTVIKREQFKSEVDERKLLTLREGSNGSINTSLNFSSPTLELTSRDVGRRLTIYGSLHPENTGKFEIVDVLSTTVCILDSLELQLETTGILVWALLRDPELTLSGSSTLRGVVERGNEDGEITLAGPPATFRSLSGRFTIEEVGKLLTLHISGNGDNGTYEVTSFISSTELGLDATLTLGTGFHWELRSATSEGDETQVAVRAPSLIQYLAQDYGIEIDTRDEEEAQRRWVESVSRWTNMKGVYESYEFLGALTGFDVAVHQLWRVSLDVYSTLPAGLTLILGDVGPGRVGTDGGLEDDGGLLKFSSPTALFTPGDEGRQIVIDNSGLGNNGMYTIGLYIDATTVKLTTASVTATVPDPAGYPGVAGTLVWTIVRLYTTQPPSLPVYDEINTDLMTLIVGAAKFTADMYCWEPGWSTAIGPGFGGGGDGDLRITAVSPATPSALPTTYVVTVDGDIDVIVGLGRGRWKLTDSSAVEEFVETVPAIHQETGAGRAGADGSLTAGPTFSTPSGAFVVGDVGKRVLIISGAASAHNERLYTIGAVGGATTVTLTETPPTVPDANNGSLVWAICDFQFEVIATVPPTLGSATVEYICPVVISCGYCPSYRLLVEANTAELLEAPFERLDSRLEQVTPKHVERVYAFGFTITASLTVGAVVVTP